MGSAAAPGSQAAGAPGAGSQQAAEGTAATDHREASATFGSTTIGPATIRNLKALRIMDLAGNADLHIPVTIDRWLMSIHQRGGAVFR